MVFARNLSSRPCQVSIPAQPEDRHRPLTIAAGGGYFDDVDLLSLDLHGYGYRRLRLNHTPWD